MTDEISDSMFVAIMVAFAGVLLSTTVTLLAYMNLVKDDVVYNFESAMTSDYIPEFRNEALEQPISGPEIYKLLVEHNDLIIATTALAPTWREDHNRYEVSVLVFCIKWVEQKFSIMQSKWESNALSNFLEDPENYYYVRLIPYENGYVLAYYNSEYWETDILENYYHCTIQYPGDTIDDVLQKSFDNFVILDNFHRGS